MRPIPLYNINKSLEIILNKLDRMEFDNKVGEWELVDDALNDIRDKVHEIMDWLR